MLGVRMSDWCGKSGKRSAGVGGRGLGQAMIVLCALQMLLVLATTPRLLAVEPAALRAAVSEVKGKFCKIPLPEGHQIKKGALGKLLDKQGDEVGDVEITHVLDSYVVGKTTAEAPEAGFTFLLPAAGGDTPPPDPTATPGGKPTADAPVEDNLDEAVEQLVDVALKVGTTLEQVKLLRVVRDEETSEAKSIRVHDAEKDRTLTLTLATIARVDMKGHPVYEAPEGDDPEKPKTRKQILAEQRAQKEAEEHARWLERLKVRGIEPWPELSDEVLKEATEEHTELIKKVQQAIPGMALYETKQFQFCSNIPPQQCQPYIISLDALHEMMCKMYGIKKGQQVWRGKCVVFAFLHQQQFIQFEQAVFQHNPAPDVYGLCHSRQDGDVIISCYRGDQPADFGHMLVHETSHGFIHRYKTAERLPTWANEGMAEYIGQALVPASKAVKIKERIAFEQMKQTRSMGGNLLTAENGIDSWQYGVASSLTDFLIRTNQAKYVKFVEGMKEGMTWIESLQAAYNVAPEQMVSAYGAAIGIPDLRP